MQILIGIAYLAAGNFFMNGLLHLLMGLLGKRFIQCPRTVSRKQFETVYSGRLFSSAVFNTIFGLFQIYLVIFLSALQGALRFDFSFETVMLASGIAASAVFLSWKYEGCIR